MTICQPLPPFPTPHWQEVGALQAACVTLQAQLRSAQTDLVAAREKLAQHLEMQAQRDLAAAASLKVRVTAAQLQAVALAAGVVGRRL